MDDGRELGAGCEKIEQADDTAASGLGCAPIFTCLPLVDFAMHAM